MSRRIGATLFVTLLLLSTWARAEERPRSTTPEAAGRGPTTWLVASGGVLFGATYLISFGMASAGAGCGNAFLGMDCVPRNDVPGSDWPLFIPVAGPFVAMATSKDRPIYTLAILGAGQIAGAALFVSGLAVRAPTKPNTELVFFSPSIYQGGAGLNFSRKF
jgi:hypothetical protein